MNNLKQIGLAIYMYASNYDDHLLRHRETNSGGVGNRSNDAWYVCLVRAGAYLGNKYAGYGYYWPGAAWYSGKPDLEARILMCPTMRGQYPECRAAYSVPTFGVGYGFPEWGPPTRIGSVTNPSNKIYITETKDGTRTIAPAYDPYPYILMRTPHNNLANVLFVDGHVEAINSNRLLSGGGVSW